MAPSPKRSQPLAFDPIPFVRGLHQLIPEGRLAAVLSQTGRATERPDPCPPTRSSGRAMNRAGRQDLTGSGRRQAPDDDPRRKRGYDRHLEISGREHPGLVCREMILSNNAREVEGRHPLHPRHARVSNIGGCVPIGRNGGRADHVESPGGDLRTR
jgi:hypothetical protein